MEEDRGATERSGINRPSDFLRSTDMYHGVILESGVSGVIRQCDHGRGRCKADACVCMVEISLMKLWQGVARPD